MIDIRGLDKAVVLKGLYDYSHIQGLGFLQAKAGPLSLAEARQLLAQTTDFDYLYGKVMKVDLSSDEAFDERLYDRDCGEGAALFVIDNIRKTSIKGVNSR